MEELTGKGAEHTFFSMTMTMTDKITETITRIDCFQKLFPPQVGNLQQIWLWRGTRFETQSKKDFGDNCKIVLPI